MANITYRSTKHPFPVRLNVADPVYGGTIEVVLPPGAHSIEIDGVNRGEPWRHFVGVAEPSPLDIRVVDADHNQWAYRLITRELDRYCLCGNKMPSPEEYYACSTCVEAMFPQAGRRGISRLLARKG